MPPDRDPGPPFDVLVGHARGRRGRTCFPSAETGGASLWHTTAALILALAFGLLAPPHAGTSQAPAKVYRIGVLGAATASGYARQIEAFRQGLRDLGYVEGKNVVLEYRWAEGRYGRLPGLAAELVRLKPDLLLTHGTPGTRAAKQATTTIPIVMATSGDAVATGLVASLAHPGGNLTGTSFFNPELAAKRLELLKEVVPGLTRMAVLLNPGNPVNEVSLQVMERTARALGLELQVINLRGPEEFDAAFSIIVKGRAGALSVYDDAMLIAQARRVADFAARNRLPAIGFREFTEAGGLMSYGVNFPDLWRRAATYVDKILKGAKPGDLPVEQPMRFELVLNLKTAKALGVTFPPSILVRADHVIQ
jgi:putative ABC transport system substrate-binding protein